MSGKAKSPPKSAVRVLLEELGANRISVTDAVTKLNAILVPSQRYAPARTADERYRRMDSHVLPPWTPNSGNEIDLAAADGTLSPEQALALRTKVQFPKAKIVNFPTN